MLQWLPLPCDQTPLLLGPLRDPAYLPPCLLPPQPCPSGNYSVTSPSFISSNKPCSCQLAELCMCPWLALHGYLLVFQICLNVALSKKTS